MKRLLHQIKKQSLYTILEFQTKKKLTESISKIKSLTIFKMYLHIIKNGYYLNGKQIKSIKSGHENKIINLISSSKGKFIATSGKDYYSLIFSGITLNLLFKLSKHEKDITSICFSSNEDYFASSSLDSKSILWDTYSGKIKYIFEVNSNEYVIKSYFATKENKFVGLTNDNNIFIWSIDTGRLNNKIKFDSKPKTICLSPNDNVLLSTINENIFLYSILNGELINKVNSTTEIQLRKE